jgi:RNA polymerase sigma-70 factor (ECF subfamily)
MAARRDAATLRWHDTLLREGVLAGLGDGRLVEQFLAHPGKAGGLAFEALVRRHGPMVLAVCRGVLRDAHEAEDAFQATFLVLARRAGTIRDRDRVAVWLARTARRIAVRSRGEALQREAVERRRDGVDGTAPVAAALVAAESSELVRAEVERLPEDDRRLMRLTYWQGKTYEEVAALLSWPVGTVRSRLSRARQRLRSNLARLGLAPALAAAVGGGAAEASAVPESLIVQAVRAATPFAGGLSAAVELGVVPAAVAALAEGEMAMRIAVPWKTVATVLLLSGTAAAGFVLRARPGDDPAPGKPAAAATGQAGSRSLLINGGVEEGDGNSPKAWTRGAAVPGVQLLWSRVGHDGKASLGLKKTAQRYFPIAEWTQTVDRVGDAPRLKVSAWVKADKVTKAILDAQFLDGDGKWSHAWAAYIGAKEDGEPPVSHDWKRYEGVVEIPPGTKRLVIAPQIYGPGSVFFDDLAAELTSQPATGPTAP